MLARCFFYGFSLLSAVHTAMAVWASKGPEVILEMGSAVWTRLELYTTLALGYVLLTAISAAIVWADED
jgi:hypothetical protein